MNRVNKNLPIWLAQSENYSDYIECRPHFLRRALSEITKVFQNEFLAEKYEKYDGLLQIIDPRVKILVLLFYIVFASAVFSIFVKILIAAIGLLFAVMSKLKLSDFLRRVWCYLPPVLFILSLPAAINLFSSGTPLIYLSKTFYFTLSGIRTALRVSLTCGISLSFVYLIFATTRAVQIEKALRALKLPDVFVSILSMAYRYIFVLASEAIKVIEARFLRTVGKVKSKDERRFVSHSIASVFLKSKKLSGDVYDAMCCRGFTGKAVSLNELKFGIQDFIFTCCNVIIVLILLLGVYAFGW